MGKIFTFSLPNGVATALMTAGFLLFDKVVADLDVVRVHEELAAAGLDPSSMSEAAIATAAVKLGTTTSLYQAATQVIIAVMMVFFMTGFGFGAASATLVSQQMGAGHPGEASKDGWWTVVIGGSLMALWAWSWSQRPSRSQRSLIPKTRRSTPQPPRRCASSGSAPSSWSARWC